jgi:hypothetical protein
LEGTIEAGDFEKFKSFILNSGNAVEVYLASPAGDLPSSKPKGQTLSRPGFAMASLNQIVANRRSVLRSTGA